MRLPGRVGRAGRWGWGVGSGRTALLILGFLCFDTIRVCAADLVETIALRKEYNRVSARIDSIVRAMESIDAGTLDSEKLPEAKEALGLPDGSQVVAIFWADDEAKIWINGHFVGETRLTPVEVVIPELYLKSENVVRAKGWDTDYVESGLLFGLYLRQNRVLHPIVVSDDSWQDINGSVETITYAHAMPNIPQAEVIWGEQTFGIVEMFVNFNAGAVRRAGDRGGERQFASGERREMSLHTFVAELSMLETERDRLQIELQRRAPRLSVPAYRGGPGQGSLTLGKAGPLKEGVTRPISERVKAWSDRLPPEQKALIYRERRRLRGEGEATAEGERVVGAGGVEDRKTDYSPPSDRRNREPGSQDGSAGSASGSEGGDGEATGAYSNGGGFAGRASRLGLLIPTLILATYAVYATHEWRRLSRET